jgi:hypothetical protein
MLRVTVDRPLRDRRWISATLKWFAIAWTVFAGGVVLLSNLMIVNNAPSIMGLLPYDTRDNLRVALLLAPGLIAALLQLILERRRKSVLAKPVNNTGA